MTTDPEDAKLVTLARASRARTGAAQGAAVRDLDGRTYTAATVSLETFRIDALDLAVAMAASSGAAGLEAAAVVGDPDRIVDLGAAREFGGDGLPVLVADPSGDIRSVTRT